MCLAPGEIEVVELSLSVSQYMLNSGNKPVHNRSGCVRVSGGLGQTHRFALACPPSLGPHRRCAPMCPPVHRGADEPLWASQGGETNSSPPNPNAPIAPSPPVWNPGRYLDQDRRDVILPAVLVGGGDQLIAGGLGVGGICNDLQHGRLHDGAPQAVGAQ
jgi:hypothetical protein